MNRELYKNPFYNEKAANWMCPTCKQGFLRIVSDTFKVLERRYSREGFNHPNWDPDWTKNIYSCMLECNNEECKEVVASSGTGGIDLDCFYGLDGGPTRRLIPFYRPSFFEPPLAIIDIPIGCPAAVTQPLQESFRLFFCNTSSSSNNVRIAIEALLTELGIPTHNKSKSTYLKLHDRIDKLPDEHIKFKEYLVAIKWLGNAGSHTSNAITIDDVMDAYEIIEHILDELYVQKVKKINALAQSMTIKYSPPSSLGED